MAKKQLSRADVAEHLQQSEWHCSRVRDYETSSLWKTMYGYYFSVAHEITEDEFMEDVWKDLVSNGRKNRLG